MTCICRRCRPATLASIAPRLARARDQLLKERAEGIRNRRWLREQALEAERILAHRELQLVRLADRGNAFLLRRQYRLLAEIKREVAYYAHCLAEAERTAA